MIFTENHPFFVWQSCFDVRESKAFWESMALQSNGGGEDLDIEWLSTHPTHQNRADKLDTLMPQVSWTFSGCDQKNLNPWARFILPANANGIRMLTSQIRNEKFTAVQLCPTHLRISLRKEGCDVKFTSDSLRIRMKYEPGLSLPNHLRDNVWLWLVKYWGPNNNCLSLGHMNGRVGRVGLKVPGRKWLVCTLLISINSYIPFQMQRPFFQTIASVWAQAYSLSLSAYLKPWTKIICHQALVREVVWKKNHRSCVTTSTSLLLQGGDKGKFLHAPGHSLGAPWNILIVMYDFPERCP